MIENLQNMIAKVLYAPVSGSTSVAQSQTSKNPYANPFMQTTTNNSQYYGKNTPVKGGYFAGYYNDKPNIVGRHLFLEV